MHIKKILGVNNRFYPSGVGFIPSGAAAIGRTRRLFKYMEKAPKCKLICRQYFLIELKFVQRKFSISLVETLGRPLGVKKVNVFKLKRTIVYYFEFK